MKILIVEDDYLQAEFLRTNLEQAFPGVKCDVIPTESGFRARLDSMVNNPPNVILMDIMLRWTDPAPDMQAPPEDVQKNGYYRAGFRCERLLAEREEMKAVPLILYTVLERIDVEEELRALSGNVIHLRKESDLEPLIGTIKQLIRR